jgi:hypothetical protein
MGFPVAAGKTSKVLALEMRSEKKGLAVARKRTVMQRAISLELETLILSA